MKKLLGGFALLTFVMLFTTGNAEAFSTAPRVFSGTAFSAIIGSDDVLNQIPINESITSIEQMSASPYQFQVKAGSCTLIVELDTSTPRGFIGNGLPHNPKVVDATGCN